jgi:uncharacterized protein (TIGR02217 family)
MEWKSAKTQNWDTTIQKSASKRRKTLSRQSYPEWEIDASFAKASQAEYEYTAGFFARMRGQAGTFLWLDPEDYKQTKVQIGTGDGVTTGFQLLRNWKDQFVEPVLDIVPGTLTVFVDDVAVDETLGDDGWDELAAAPAVGAIITASFEYYWRVACAKDEKTWTYVFADLYTLKGVKMVTVR